MLRKEEEKQHLTVVRSEMWLPSEWLMQIKKLIEANNVGAMYDCLAEIKRYRDRVEIISAELNVSTEGRSHEEAYRAILTALNQKYVISNKGQDLFVSEGMMPESRHLRYAIAQLDFAQVTFIMRKCGDTIANPFEGLSFSFFSHPYRDDLEKASRRRLLIACRIVESLSPQKLKSVGLSSILRTCAVNCNKSTDPNVHDEELIRLLASHADCFAALHEHDIGRYRDIVLREACKQQEMNPAADFRKSMEDALGPKDICQLTDLALFKHLLSLMGGFTLPKYDPQLFVYTYERVLRDKPDFLQAIYDINKKSEVALEPGEHKKTDNPSARP